MVAVFIDNRAERFGAEVTIADLAALTFTQRRASPSRLCAAAAVALVRHEWPWEVESILATDGKGVAVLFRDGSHIEVPTPRQSRIKPVAHWRFDTKQEG